uniref:Uncharacterized protein n=1 Tax=Pygocentrus nattereri TaxID=42514 RepID=A0A3B4CSF0_PYGNA
VCTRSCLFMLPIWEKALPHTLQLKGRSPVWMRMWHRSISGPANVLWQRVHGICMRGFSWLRTCLFKSNMYTKDLPHIEHKYLRSPMKLLPHTLHWYARLHDFWLFQILQLSCFLFTIVQL